MASNYDFDVVIVGGGPAGLVLAHSCLQHKLSFVLLEKNFEPGKLSKATGIHRHSMKYLHDLNLSGDILDHAVKLDECITVEDGTTTQTIRFSHGPEPYAQNVSLSQEVLEKILLSRIPQELVLYGYEAFQFEDSNDVVTLKAKHISTGEIKTIKSRYLAAANGAKCFIRDDLDIKFEGVTSDIQSLSFDAKLDPAPTPTPNKMFFYIGKAGRMVVVPISKDGEYKISGGIKGYTEPVSRAGIAQIVNQRSGLRVREDTIRNETYYHIHCRLADRFRHGNICLLGDAAHVFYPAGGYGLNVAIEDAIYLGEALSVAIQFGRKEVFDIYATYRRKASELVREDATKKRTQSMKPSTQNEDEQQIYDLEEYQAVNHAAFLSAIEQYKTTQT